jgi:DNA-binding PadR family transcriptional regulator
MARPRLSELESAVLGVFWRRGPCSAYAVQQNFQPISAGWSASPGSVYPLVRKLHRLGLIEEAERERRGARLVQRYTLTPEGRTLLRSWLLSFPGWAGLPPADAIRTRSFFLDALSPAARAEFFRQAEARTREALAEFRADTDAFEPDSLQSLARMGGAFHLEARLRWLRKIKKRKLWRAS